MLPDQVGWLGIGSRECTSSEVSCSRKNYVLIRSSTNWLAVCNITLSGRVSIAFITSKKKANYINMGHAHDRCNTTHITLQGLEKSPTGIGGLDEITDGGLPKGRPTLMSGGAGSGKTLMSMQFLAQGATQVR